MAKRVKGHGYRVVTKQPGDVTGICKCGAEFAGATQSEAYSLFQVHKEAAEISALISSHFPYKPVFGVALDGGQPPIVGWRAPRQGECGWETYMSS